MTNEEKQRQQEILNSLEKGRRLYQIRNSEGWVDLLDILETEAVLGEIRLFDSPEGASNELLRDLRAYARAARSIYEKTQIRVNNSIEQSTKAVLAHAGDSSEYTNL